MAVDFIRLIPARIVFYSGAREEETPREFTCEGVRYVIDRLLEEQLVEDKERSTSRVFKVRVEGGRVFTLVYRDGQGFLVQEEY